MNKLLNIIANDLSIVQYFRESDNDLTYRVCYSALALWMLKLTSSRENGVVGISKQTQSLKIEELLLQYQEYFKLNPSFFAHDKNKEHTLSRHIRRVYEETGYLFSDENNHSVAANYGRTICATDGNLFFGNPESGYWMNGLGIYSPTAVNDVDLFEAMLRDTLTIDEYITVKYNPLDFEERDLDVHELKFFDPTRPKPPSSSWHTEQITDKSIARNNNWVMYRTLIDETHQILFKEEPPDSDKGRLTSFEIRRLYCALKAKYGAPIIAWFNRLDDLYSQIRISAQLPNREYYFMLLFAWPEQNAFNRTKFICKNNILPTVARMLCNIGIEIRGYE